MADAGPGTPRDVRSLAADALETVERGREFAKDVLEDLRPAVSDPRDRGLLTEIVYGVLRRRGTLDALLAGASRPHLHVLDPAVRAALRVGLYQVLFLERVPVHAAVDRAVAHAKERTNPRFAGFVNGVLRGLVRAVEGPVAGASAEPEDPMRDVPRPGARALRMRRPVFADPATDLARNLAERFAHPEWLVKRWLSRHPADVVRAICLAGASRPPLSLRARAGQRDALVADLRAAGVEAHAGEGPDSVLAAGGEAAGLGPVLAGRAYVQDETAQRVAPLLRPRAGERLLDLCAAPGGKTIHLLDLLDLLGASGEVVACDVSAEKVAALRSALAGRFGAAGAGGGAGAGARASVVEVVSAGPLPFEPASVHGILVDAPCSNTGVFRRRVEARDRLREGDINHLAAAQRELLDRAAALVRPGGRLVYSTCSIEPEENGGVTEAFLAAHPGWKSRPGFDVLPTPGADGGYAVVLLAPESP